MSIKEPDQNQAYVTSVWVVNRDDGRHDLPPEAVYATDADVRAAYPDVPWIADGADRLYARVQGKGIFADRFEVRHA